MLHVLQNLAKESIPMETTICFSCVPNSHIGKNPLQILSFKIPLPFLPSKGSRTVVICCVRTGCAVRNIHQVILYQRVKFTTYITNNV
jgi:hypothetical protein